MTELTEAIKKLFEFGQKEGYVQSTSVPFIPELNSMGPDITTQLLQGLIEYYQNHGGDFSALPLVFTGWCAYAGIGAVYFWNEDWPLLQKKGLYAALTEEQGLYAMDDFVMDHSGFMSGTPKAQALQDHLQKAYAISISAFCKGSNKEEIDPMKATLSAGVAMYNYGIVIAMNRLGMR